jgi:hypothetical protein
MAVRIIACLQDPEDREALLHGIGQGERILWCATATAVEAAVRSIEVSGVVWEMRPESAQGVVAGVRMVVEADNGLPQLVRFELGIATARGIVELSAIPAAPVHLSLRHFDSLDNGLTTLAHAYEERNADLVIVERITRLIKPPQLEIAIGAVVLAKRRRHVPELATACHRSVSALNAQLRKAKRVPPEMLLGRLTSLHAVQKMEALCRSVKRVASEMGFGSAEAFSQYVARHLGARPQELLNVGGFIACLERFPEALSAGPA